MSPGPAMVFATEELRPEMAEDTSPIEKFPLSPGCFHPKDSQRQEFADLVRGRVDTLLADEKRYMERRDQLLPPLDPHEWKQVQMSKQLRFFKRIRGGRTLRQLANEESLPDVRQAVENGYSTMICDGQVQGLMEEMMYGMTASSQEDLMTGFWYKNPPRDCVWLGTAEGPTAQDPFHSADFIWAFPKLTAYNVDICYLKATGVERDEDGRRYGYLVLHSVELPQCRPFEARGVSRAKMYMACLFREMKPGYLNVTVRGIFDLGKRGKIAKKLVTAATKSFMGGLVNGVGIGLAKKLTLLARRNRDTLQSFKKSECSICFKTKKKLLFGLDRQLLRCGVCKTTICSSCVANTKQVLFLGLDAPISKRPCCTTCMNEARATCGILPGEPEFQVIADYYLRRRSRPSMSSNSPPAYSSPLPEMYPLDTVTRHRGSGRRRSIPMLKSTSSTDMPTNSTADDSLDTDPFSRELDEADFCFSDEESNSSIIAQFDPSPIMSSDSDKSTVVVWKTHRHDFDDDFIPGGRQRSEYEVFQLRLLQLNIQAENTLMQTQATARELRGADLD
ncbi:hypothetical protein DVH05_000794 [Phytophthora capsici]|nr:hypothetical protein DVH05_000794 [Phytophthora capsici]